MGESVAFDRAAEFYDRTRAISDESMARTIELLGSELRERGPVLEVGCGTGLLALPLHEAGIDVTGVDLSPAMIGKLVEKAGGTSPLPLVLADATRLPFGDGAFGAAYLRWVLHLIPDWRNVLAEVDRVVRPGGVFLVNLGAYGGPRKEIQERFAEITGVPIKPVGLHWGDYDELESEMTALGGRVRELPSVHEGGTETLGEFVEGIEENRYSWTWSLADDQRLRAAAEIRSWAQKRFGALDEPRAFEHATRWLAYDLGHGAR
ncbi:MAG: class I SAM-dependent methyltransferase [Actinomycetota bacterium]